MRKVKISYNFIVEGENEKWYLQRFQKLVNTRDNSNKTINFNIKVLQSRYDDYIKSDGNIYDSAILFIFDYEKDEKQFRTRIKDVMGNGKVKPNCRREIYYSNISFDLWVLLHKIGFNKPCHSNNEYLKEINTCFSKNFERISDFKKERNFKECLENITLEEVVQAIKRADKMMQNIDKTNEKQCCQGLSYYKENPSLTVHIILSQILQECGIIK